MPDLAFLETLNSILPWVGDVVIALVATCLFIYYVKKYTPAISRQLTHAYHSRGLPMFVQNEMGVVRMLICDKKFPKGVVHVPKIGWFLLPTQPTLSDSEEVEQEEPRKAGRPPKVPEKPIEAMDEKELAEYARLYGTIIKAPYLDGLNKQVFFGTTDCAGVSNLTTIAHADLPNVQWLAKQTYNKAQIDSLATGCRDEGYKMASKETTKLLMYAIIVCAPIACFAIAAWLLTQHPTAAAAVVGVF
jgi:hypothetical protein